MAWAIGDIRHRVHALQSGEVAAAQSAAKWLAEFQQTRSSARASAALLEEAFSERDELSAFFAAQTLASRARLALPEDGVLWPPLAGRLLEVLQGAAEGALRLSPAVLRQLCVAFVRLVVLLSDGWPGAVEEAVKMLRGASVVPLLEVLQALAEEPFSRRFLVDGSLRSRFLLGLRGHVPGLLGTIGALADASAKAPDRGACGVSDVVILRCSAAWLLAQPGFEEWLPMVGFGGASGAHPSLAASEGVFSLAVRAARLELGFEAFEAASALLEAAVPLATDLNADGARSTIGPLLLAFMEVCAKLPSPAEPAPRGELGDVVGVLLVVINAVVAAPAWVDLPSRAELLAFGARLLVLSGQEEGLLGRAFDAWESLRSCSPSPGEAILAEAFGHLLAALPQAMLLPQTPTEADVSRRSRASQLLTVWCDESDSRTAALLSALSGLCAQLPSFQDPGHVSAAAWAKLELLLLLASATAEAIAGTVADAGARPPPEPLPQLLATLPSLPLSAAPSPWASLLAAGAAELVVSLDPWINASLLPRRSYTELLAFAFRLAEAPSAAEALGVVVSNFAPQIAAEEALAEECLGRLRGLVLSTMPIRARERVVRSALGPLLGRLEARQRGAVEALASALSAQGPASARLLCHLFAAVDPVAPELPLLWLSAFWPCLEAALAAEGAAGAACHWLTSALSRARHRAEAKEAALRGASLLLASGSAEALGAMGTVVRIFRGGGDDEAMAGQLARHAGEAAARLAASGREAASLPPEVLAALLELLCASLPPRCEKLALELLRLTDGLLGTAVFVMDSVAASASPRVVCLSLLFADRLLAWLARPEAEPFRARLVDGAAPVVTTACCRLLATSPMAQDRQVCSALSVLWLSMCRLLPGTMQDALSRCASDICVSKQELELLAQQMADPMVSEDSFAEALCDTAGSWQAERLKRALG